MDELKNGIIYIIKCNDTNKFYIGSTANKLTLRIKQHLAHYKTFNQGKNNNYLSSFEIIKNNNYTFEILEKLNYNYILELREREKFYINFLNKNNECVNKSSIIKYNNALKNYKILLSENEIVKYILDVFEHKNNNLKLFTYDEFIKMFNLIMLKLNLNLNDISNRKRIGLLNSLLKNSKYKVNNKQIRKINRIRVYFINEKYIYIAVISTGKSNY